jgi:uncharacterized membrane protein YhhN
MKKFFLGYGILSMVVITVKLLGLDQFETWLKPLLMPSLMGFYFFSKKNLKFYDVKILLALLFSTIGDILLMPIVNLFIGGILGFLIAHAFYISAFLSEDQSKINLSKSKVKFLLAIGILVYMSLLALLFPQLDSLVLKIAIFIYGSILLLLLISSILRKPKNPKSFDYVLIGAFLFMLSDSMIAINKFLIEIPVSALLIMGSYTLAQAFLVFGSLNRDR